MKYNLEYLMYELVRGGISKSEISQKYSLDLFELYKICKILNSRRCSDYKSYLELFVKKFNEYKIHAAEIHNFIDNLDQNTLQEYKEKTIEFLNKCKALANDQVKVAYDECLNEIQNMDNEKFKQIIKSWFRFTNTGYSSEKRVIDEVLNEMDNSKVEQLNVDAELERIRNLEPSFQREYNMTSYHAYVLQLGVASNVIQNAFIPTIQKTFSEHLRTIIFEVPQGPKL